MARQGVRRSVVVFGLALSALTLSAGIGAAAERPAGFYERRAAEIQAYLVEHFAEVVPQATAFEVRDATTDAGGFRDGQGYFLHWVAFVDAIGPTGLVLRYDEPGHFGETPESFCAGPGTATCTIGGLPDGSALVTTTDAWTERRRVLGVYHFRTDGGVTYANGFNHDPFLDGEEGPLRADFAVTEQQLTRLVTDPALTL